MERTVKIVAYDPQWAKQYKEESAKVKKILGDNYSGCYHIGSTVIKGAKAQPIIDILVIVKKAFTVDGKIPQFEEAGYEYRGEQEDSSYRFFVKEASVPHVHLYVFEEKQAQDIARFYSVSSYLASHETERKEFEMLKERLAEQYANVPESYEEEKQSHIAALEEKALEWQLKQNKLGSYMAMGMSMGLASGCAIGYIFGQMLWGMVIGVVAGLMLGTIVGRQKAGK